MGREKSNRTPLSKVSAENTAGKVWSKQIGWEHGCHVETSARGTKHEADIRGRETVTEYFREYFNYSILVWFLPMNSSV